MGYDVKDLGPAPIISHICRQLKVRQSVNQEVPWDEKQYGEHPHLEGFQVNRGYNKEGRSDLKQIKIGLVTNQDGFPVTVLMERFSLGALHFNYILAILELNSKY